MTSYNMKGLLWDQSNGGHSQIQQLLSMEEEQRTASLNSSDDYPELVSLLVLFLHSPSPDVQHRLSLFSPNTYLRLILNPSEPRQVRQACCASFKSLIINRPRFQPCADAVLQQFQAIHFNTDPKVLTDVSGSFQILTEKLFQLYLDDEKKLGAFTSIMQRISNNCTLQTSAANLRGVRLAQLLLRAMDPSTLNNEVSIGELICYLKQLYLPKHRISDPASVSGRGLEFLQSAMSELESEGNVAALLELQAEVLTMVKDIIQRLEVEELQGDNVPAAYIRNSDQIDNLFQAILCVSADGRIFSHNRKANQLKALVMSLYLEQFPYHVAEPLLIMCLNTISKCQAAKLGDEAETLVAGALQMLERSTNHAPYAQCYYNNTQLLVLKLFQLVAPREAELQAADEDPQHFVEIADDFCKNQESDCVKVRAGSLIYNLALTVDGNLTFIANMALIPLHAFEVQLSKQLFPQQEVRKQADSSSKGLPVLLDLWSGRPEGLTDASLLVLSCLSDLIIKRAEFNYIIRLHLNVITTFLQERERAFSIVSPIILSRYIQLFSFYSFPSCLDAFLPLYHLRPLFAQALLKSLQTLMQFHDKKSEPMRNYVSMISAKILLLGDKLTPLLQQTVLSRPQLILCVKHRIVQKLVNWLLDFYDKENLFGCNKISNLLCKVIEQYQQFTTINNQNQEFNIDLETLTTYLVPLYRRLQVGGCPHPAEECMVDVAVQHLECLGVRIEGELLLRFVEMGIAVVEHNDFILNKCLELFSRALSLPGMGRNQENNQYAKIRKTQIQAGNRLLNKVCQWLQNPPERDSDRWQLMFLLQIILVTLLSERPQLGGLNMNALFLIYSTSSCDIVKLKVYEVWMLVVQIIGDGRCEAGQYMRNSPLPQNIPPYQRSNFMIYLMGAITPHALLEHRVILLHALLGFFFPSERDKHYLKDYESSLHCSGSFPQAEIDAFQTVQSVLHPLNALGIDTYTEFRNMFHRLTDWHEMRQRLSQQDQAAVRQILGHEMVGVKPRRILHVKK